MHWEHVFEDLAAQWDVAQLAHVRGEIADRTRRERASVRLLDRLCAQLSTGVPLDIELLGGHRVAGVPVDLGADFVELADGPTRRFVRVGAMVCVAGLGYRSAAASDVAAACRLGLGYGLRTLARDRAHVIVADVRGGRWTGTIDAVAADHLDLRDRAADGHNQTAGPHRTFPFAAIASVSTA